MSSAARGMLAAAAVACGGGDRAPAPGAADSPRTVAASAPAVPPGDSTPVATDGGSIGAPPPSPPPPAPPAPAGPFSYVRRVGVLQQSRDAGRCLVIADSSLAVGTPLLIVFPDSPQHLGSGYVRARRARACTESSDEWGSVQGGDAADAPEHAAYDVALASGASGDLGIAITWGAGLVALRGDSTAAGDLDGDGRPERFGSCTSHEGIHLTVTADSAGAAVRRWHRYYYVPYELEPSCPGMAATDDSSHSR